MIYKQILNRFVLVAIFFIFSFKGLKCNFIDDDMENDDLLLNITESGSGDEAKIMVRKYDKVPFGKPGYDTFFTQFGICQVEDEVSNITQLKGCKEITSDLVITKATGEWSNSDLIVVEGCVNVFETNLKDVDFLLKLEKVDCTAPTGSGVYSNPLMCLNETVKERLGPLIPRLETAHKHCPTCTDKDFESTANCGTFVGDLNVFLAFPNKTVVERSIVNLKEVVGRVTIRVQNDEIPSQNETDDPVEHHKFDYKRLIERYDRFIINCPTCEEPGLTISGKMIPPIEFFDFLDMQLGNTRVAILFEKSGSYRMLRGLYAALMDRFKKEVVVEHEEDGDCHFAKLNTPYDFEDLIGCERITGDLVYNATGVRNLHRAQWKTLKLDGENLTLIGGSDLIKLLSHEVSVDFKIDDFLFYIDFEKDLCMDAQMLQGAYKWMHKGPNKENQNRVMPNNEDSCTVYSGNVTAYDLRYDDGMRFHTVRGTVHLDALAVKKVLDRVRMKMGTPKAEIYKETDIARFKYLQRVKKPWTYPKDMPVLRIDMCSNIIPVPDWLTNVTVESDREDDVLMKVTGPAFKMDNDTYNFLKSKFGEHRLDIHPLLDEECRFENNVTDLTQLNNCETVVGDLILEGPITGETESIIKHVTGCIRIVDTTLMNLDFLRFEIPYDIKLCEECRGPSWFSVTGNSELCATHTFFNLHKDNKHLVSNNKPGCGNNLTENALVEENIVIGGYSNESELAHLSEVVEVYGRIIITSNSFEKLTVFENLRLIKHMGPGPAILIERNPNLTTFTLPAIEEIIALDKNVIVLRDNPKLVTEQQKSQYEKVLKQGNIVVEESEEVDNYLLHGFLVGFFVLLCLSVLAIGGTILSIVLVKRLKKKHAAKKAKKEAKNKENADEGPPKEEKATLTDSAVENKNDSAPTDTNNNVPGSAPTDEQPATKSAMTENTPIV